MSTNRVKRNPSRTTFVPSQLTASTALEHFFETGLDFNLGVAVWMPGSKEMSNDIIQYLNLTAIDHKYVSQCMKFKMRTKLIGMIYLFEDRDSATMFRSSLSEGMSPHGDYPFVTQNLGTYLRAVAEIEDQLNLTKPDGSNVESKVLIRNTLPRERVTKKVLRLCAIFGNVIGYVVYKDKGECFHFRHIVVSYRFATQAFAAKLGLDSKWIPEQDRPLGVTVETNEKIIAINKELLRRDILIFQA